MEKKLKYDFSGWATRNDLVCSDGRTIRRDAFVHCDGKTVPLVWNHQHDDPTNILGHALLENREDGVYAYCTFNETAAGKAAKLIVQHGDVDSLSIYANGLKQQGGNVMHGDIKELMIYDCIVYERSRIEPTFADNQPYALHDRYQVTVIYRNPDSEIPSKIALLPMCSHERHYTKENLNHDVFNLYF